MRKFLYVSLRRARPAPQSKIQCQRCVVASKNCVNESVTNAQRLKFRDRVKNLNIEGLAKVLHVSRVL